MQMDEKALFELPVEQRAELAVIRAGAKALADINSYVGGFNNLLALPIIDKEMRDTHRSVENELSGEIKRIETACKAAGEDAFKLHKAVVAVKKQFLEPLETLRNKIETKRKVYDAEIKAASEAKKNRLQDIKNNIEAITQAPLSLIGASSAQIEESLTFLQNADTENQAHFGEFTEKAKEEQAKAIRAIEAMLLQAKTAEEQAAQLAEIKRQQAEIERKNLELAEQQAKAEKAKQEAESSKLIAEKERAETEARFLREAEAKRLADEAKARAEAEEQARKAALMPDKQKIISFADGLVNWSKTNAPALEREEANTLLGAVLANIEKMAAQIKGRAGAL